jgi:signal transduction histidine kinase
MARARVQSDSTATLDARWLAALHQICNRAAHELKGALNGVAVNLEVVRSRAEKPGPPAASVAQFANAAVDQLDGVISLTEALLSLSRPEREPVNVALVVRNIETLLVPAIRADDKEYAAAGRLDDLGFSTAPGNAVRLAVGASLLAASDAGVRVGRSVDVRHERPGLRIEAAEVTNATATTEAGAAHRAAGAPRLRLDEDILDALSDAGIDIQAESSAISISFPFDSKTKESE